MDIIFTLLVGRIRKLFCILEQVKAQSESFGPVEFEVTSVESFQQHRRALQTLDPPLMSYGPREIMLSLISIVEIEKAS